MDAFVAKIRGGAMIMKSVSLFLASGRRASSARCKADRDALAASGAPSKSSSGKKKRRSTPADMDPSARNANKLSPKMLEVLRRKTHFTK